MRSELAGQHPLRPFLRARRLSQSQLARRLDMNESLLSHYLAFRRTPPADFYARVADVLAVPVESITPAAAEPERQEQAA